MHMNVQMNCQLDLRSNLKRALKTSRNLVAVFLLKTNVPPSSCVDSYLSVLRRSAIHLWHALQYKNKKKEEEEEEHPGKIYQSVKIRMSWQKTVNKRKNMHTFGNVHHCKPNNFASTCTMFHHELIDLWQQCTKWGSCVRAYQ